MTTIHDHPVEVRRGGDVSAEIDGCWCSLDAITHRPARLADDIVRLIGTTRSEVA